MNANLQAVTLAVTFIVMGRFLSNWSSFDLLRFVIFSNLAVGLCSFMCQIFLYMTSFNYKHLEQPVSGGMGLIAAFVVTIKQRLPEVLSPPPTILFEVKCRVAGTCCCLWRIYRRSYSEISSRWAIQLHWLPLEKDRFRP